MPRGDQLARQWRLLQFLSRPEGVAVEVASRQLGCAVRTVWRDLAVLQAAGFPIYDERDGPHRPSARARSSISFASRAAPSSSRLMLSPTGTSGPGGWLGAARTS